MLIRQGADRSHMERNRPESPKGVRDLNSQPAVPTDKDLHNLRNRLEQRLSDDLFEDLSRWTDIMEDEAPDDAEEYRQRALSYVETSIDYREAIRPNSLRPADELPTKVGRITTGAWVYYKSGYDVDHSRPESDAKDVESGKYLLFTPDKARVLEDIVLEEFQQRPYKQAKLPTTVAKKEDWVLCLYQPDNRYWYDVRDAHQNEPTVRFRGFKTNAATKRGEYSERFEKQE